MKREAWDHPKFKLVARDLDLPLCFVRGIVESIWLVTSINFPRGDIGRWSNEEIAFAIDYRGDIDSLVNILVNRKLLDAHPVHRLIVHDWPDHCDDAIQYKIARYGLVFANGTESKRKKSIPSATVNDSRRQSKTVGDGLPEPEPEPEPEPVKEIHTGARIKSDSRRQSATVAEFEIFWQAYPSRGGRRIGRKKAEAFWRKLPAEERPQVLAAAKNYAADSRVAAGFAQDAWRWLRDATWKDWLEEINPESRVATAADMASWGQ